MENTAMLRIQREMQQKTGTLDLSKLGLEKLPTELLSCTWLRTLNLSNNGLTSVHELSRLPHLRALYLNANRLTDINFLTRYYKLTVLGLNDNQISSIEPIARVASLKNLYLAKNRIIDISPLKALDKLENLFIAENLIENIECLASLQNLIFIRLNKNKIKNISPLQSLPRIAYLYLDNNQIKSLDPLRSSFDSIAHLDIEDNPILDPPLEVIQQGLHAIQVYYNTVSDNAVERIHEAKLLIVGEGGSGKTSLARKLLDKNAQLPTESEITRGIDIHTWKFENTEKEKVCVNIWDFGGHGVYHIVHQFFFTQRALYVLLDDTRKDHKSYHDTTFQYWLQTIELYGHNSPLIIVQNEKGDISKNLDLSSMKGRFPFIKDKYSTNLYTGRGLEAVKRSIQYHLEEQLSAATTLPAVWLNIRADLEMLQQAGRNYIYQWEYMGICAKYQITEPSAAFLLSQYLHDLGVILHFQKKDNWTLPGMLILNKEWLMEAMYKILDNPYIQKNGKFDKSEIDIIWSKLNRGTKLFLLDLMVNFELCYKLPNAERYLVPQFLPNTQPKYNSFEVSDATIVIKYNFIPNGLFSKFIIKVHSYILNNDKVWFNGVVLKYNDAGAEIICTYGLPEIVIRIKGSDSRDMIAILKKEFDELHQQYQGMQAEFLLPCICSECSKLINSEKYYFEWSKLKAAQSKKRTTIECHKSFEQVSILELIADITADLIPRFVHPAAHHILFLSASPDSERRIRVDKEELALKDAYERSHFREKWNVITKPAITPTYLRNALAMYPSLNVVHLAVHGSLDEMAMEYDEIRGSNVSIAELKTLVKECIDSKKEKGYERLDCIILNACDSAATAKTISDLGIYAIGMRGAIEDNRATEFTQLFYTQLFAGRTYYQSFCSAVKLLRYQNEIPRLYKNGDDITPE